jgi:DNA-binding LytR/AlgR family response regulator
MNILIIEDEIRTAKELQGILMQIDDTINVLKIIDSVEDATSYLSENSGVDLIFSDIQLVDGNCFEIYNNVHVNCPIIFCTAFDEYTLEAFDTNAVSYILKPITIEKIEAALEKYKTLKAAFQPSQTIAQLNKVSRQLKLSYKGTLLVEQRGKIIPLPVNDIAFFYLEITIVKILTHNNQSYYITSSLDDLERQLDPQAFYRANRQFLIHKIAIANIERYFSRKLSVKLKIDTPENIIVSKAKANEFLRWVEGLE